MNQPTLKVFPNADQANAAAAELLATWLTTDSIRHLMLAAGNTPLELYRLVGERKLPLDQLNVYALDEYLGVPVDEPRNCANLIRRTAIEPWGIPPDRYFTISSDEAAAAAGVLQHERRIRAAGGLDAIVLGLGQNGHLGFNEPGSAGDSGARILDLDPISVEANRKWFGGDHAPSRGVTVGMQTILSARRVLIMAYGDHKRAAVKAMIEGPRTEHCPASLLQGHPCVHLFLDPAAGGTLKARP